MSLSCWLSTNRPLKWTVRGRWSLSPALSLTSPFDALIRHFSLGLSVERSGCLSERIGWDERNVRDRSMYPKWRYGVSIEHSRHGSCSPIENIPPPAGRKSTADEWLESDLLGLFFPPPFRGGVFKIHEMGRSLYLSLSLIHCFPAFLAFSFSFRICHPSATTEFSFRAVSDCIPR